MIFIYYIICKIYYVIYIYIYIYMFYMCIYIYINDIKYNNTYKCNTTHMYINNNKKK